MSVPRSQVSTVTRFNAEPTDSSIDANYLA